MNYVAALQAQLEAMGKTFVQMLPSLAIAIVLLIITALLARSAVSIADRLTRRATMRADLKQLVDTMVRLAIWIVGLLIALTVAIPSFTPAGAFASLGVGALAIGFAFQDIFENFLAGVLIMLRDSMNIGDTIECQNITGKVEKITLRETHIRQPTNELTVVPNSMLFKNPVKITTDTTMKRDEVTVGVSYDARIDEAEGLIRKAIEGIEAVSPTPRIVVAARQFGPSSVDILVQWWSDTGKHDGNATRSSVVKAIKAALDGAGVEIPYPTTTNTFKEALPIDRARADAPKLAASRG